MNNKIIIISFSIFILLLLGVFGFMGIRESEAEPGIVTSPKIFAHRGANDRFNESTITAYEIASKDNVDALELDLRMTKDHVLIIMHDETIDRTTNGTGKVSELTLEEIKSYETVGKYNGEITREEIPTLEELFKIFGDKQNYYIETRLVNGETIMEEALIKMLTTYNLLDKEKVTIQSFSEESLEKMATLAPDLRLTLLFRKGKFDLEKALAAKFPVIGLESTDASLKVINALHSNGKEVHVFFNDSDSMKEQQKKMKELNVDGYFTDDILYTRELLDK